MYSARTSTNLLRLPRTMFKAHGWVSEKKKKKGLQLSYYSQKGSATQLKGYNHALECNKMFTSQNFMC